MHIATASTPLKSDVAQIDACHSYSEGAHIPWRMETPSLGGPVDMEPIQGCSGRPVCLPEVLPLPALLLSD